MSNEEVSFGVFKPVGHVVVALATRAMADAAHQALARIGLDGEADVRRLTDREMLAQSEAGLQQASPLASFGRELDLVKAHHALAERGHHWLIVRAAGDEQARRIADVARDCGAESAQSYGNFIIEELIEPADEPRTTR